MVEMVFSYLHQVERHGQEGYSEQQVERTEGDAEFRVLLNVLGRYKVPETCCSLVSYFK